MFDLSTITSDTPLAYVALAVIYNLIRQAILLHHERKQEASDAATQERIVALSSQLARAQETIKNLEFQVAKFQERTVEKVKQVQHEVQELKEKGA